MWTLATWSQHSPAGVRYARGLIDAEAVRVAGKSGISQARSRLGEAALRRLYDEV